MHKLPRHVPRLVSLTAAACGGALLGLVPNATAPVLAGSGGIGRSSPEQRASIVAMSPYRVRELRLPLKAAAAVDSTLQPPGLVGARGERPYSVDLAYVTSSGVEVHVWQTNIPLSGPADGTGKDPAADGFGEPYLVDGAEWHLVTLSDGTGHQLGRRMANGDTVEVDGQLSAEELATFARQLQATS